MSNTKVTDTIVTLVAPLVSDLKLDLYDLEFSGGILRITVDTPPGSDGGVTLDQLSLITRLIGRDFDHHDPIPGHYTLEVTSPGLERPLRTPAHFRREIGKTVNVRLRATVDGERRLLGVLVAADETTATLRLDSGDRVIALDMVDRAKTVFQWDRGEKATRKPAARKSATSGAPPKGSTKPSHDAAGMAAGVAAGAVKPPPGPSDELDPPTLEEATA